RFVIQVTHDEAEAVGADLLRFKRPVALTEIGQVNALVRELACRAAADRQVLDGVGVPVLETPVGDAAGIQPPAPPHGQHRVGRGPAALVQAVQRVLARLGRLQVGQLFHEEIVGLLFELHGSGPGWHWQLAASGTRGGGTGSARKKRGREMVNSKASPSHFRIIAFLSTSPTSVRGAAKTARAFLRNFPFSRVDSSSLPGNGGKGAKAGRPASR